MKKLVCFSVFFVLLSCFAAVFSQESVTLTTYYPAPYGVYNELRSKRVAIGENYYSNSAYPWDDGSSLLDNEILQNADLVVEGPVGIGTLKPYAPLHISVDGNFTTPALIFGNRDPIYTPYPEPLARPSEDAFGYIELYGGSSGGLGIRGFHNGVNAFNPAMRFVASGVPNTEHYYQFMTFQTPDGHIIDDADTLLEVCNANCDQSENVGLKILGNRNVGLGVLNPVSKLDVDGGVKIANDSRNCTSRIAGTLRYNGGNIEYCHDNTWQSVGGPTGDYGGMYLKKTNAPNNNDNVNWECFGTNPYTGNCSCPPGYNDHKWGNSYPTSVLWCGAYVYWFHTCWR